MSCSSGSTSGDRRLVELEHLALELVDALDRVRVGLGEHLELDLTDVVLDAVDDRP